MFLYKGLAYSLLSQVRATCGKCKINVKEKVRQLSYEHYRILAI